ncbi:alpha/beta hydrolase [Sphingobium phenoxybenzoativorans]|uniref:Alpha/beta hydrolase n=1 Tax=Sphingobium phenoxybenzoativorans TaxID=1592790 RepID=A0A975K9R2_9SPHN|nr:alpha/beta fold hydrolase [Sphingobium phenoxybenzoativorans]QUT06022.1 alpha/beta hydrolase [Sphingobium phenoxybenzoativorans]
MTTFILVHGAWHGGWCFDRVTALLRDAGHDVLAPDLPGMGGSEEELARVTLQGWADFVADLCRAASSQPVVLAGHSRGGIVISQAAEAAPEAVGALVYICAMMLPDGMSRASFRASEPANAAYDGFVSPTAGGHGSLITGEDPEKLFAQRSPPDAAAAAMSRLVAEPEGPRLTALSLSPGRWGSIPRTYVECTDDRVIPLASQRRMQALCPGTRRLTLAADHSPFLSRPHELAACLIASTPETRSAAPA